MPVVNISIRNNQYQIACDIGQETSVKNYANLVNERVLKCAKSFPKANDLILLIMSSLMLEDELNEIKKENQELKELLEKEKKLSENNKESADSAVADAIDAVSDYIETIAKKIEKA